jgi:hypothetical protein
VPTVSIVIKSMPEVYIRRLLSEGTLGAMARRRSRPASDHRHQPLRMLAGTALMLGSVAVALAILTHYAGGWGVPYFSFTTDRGSTCKNALAGYTCSPMTLADVEYFGDVNLPDDSSVVAGTYHATHDYQMEAVIEVPSASADQALTDLNDAFGKCVSDGPSPLSTSGMRRACVIANEDGLDDNNELSSRLYMIGTGIRTDGTRIIGMVIRSR